jgi:hypothetical protein
MSDQSQTDRRQFLQRSLLGTTGLGMAIASTSEVHAKSETGEVGVDLAQEVDVLVVGGGTAGNIAAIQAGRAGASTLLVELRRPVEWPFRDFLMPGESR